VIVLAVAVAVVVIMVVAAVAAAVAVVAAAAVAFSGQDQCANLFRDLFLRLEAELTQNRALGSEKEGPNRAVAGEGVAAAECFPL
jgi:hypothetical protein